MDQAETCDEGRDSEDEGWVGGVGQPGEIINPKATRSVRTSITIVRDFLWARQARPANPPRALDLETALT
jgi:hypothetical protein